MAADANCTLSVLRGASNTTPQVENKCNALSVVPIGATKGLKCLKKIQKNGVNRRQKKLLKTDLKFSRLLCLVRIPFLRMIEASNVFAASAS